MHAHYVHFVDKALLIEKDRLICALEQKIAAFSARVLLLEKERDELSPPDANKLLASGRGHLDLESTVVSNEAASTTTSDRKKTPSKPEQAELVGSAESVGGTTTMPVQL